ncbi:hypothetical protein MMC25_002950 [Agyrium rufum]|nr:hypothetical protein [Agyrium rufum]
MAIRLDDRNALSQEEKIAIVECFWRLTPSNENMARYDSFFDFYSEEILALSLAMFEKDRILPKMAAQTHEELRKIVKVLEESGDKKLSEVLAILQPTFPGWSLESITRSINLAVRLWLLINTRDKDDINPGDLIFFKWEQNAKTLREFVADQMPSVASQLPAVESTIDPQFTAESLCKTYGIRLFFTNCLADHLYLDANQRLHVFQHRICLNHHRNNSQTASRRIYSEELLEESIWSLNLLFPSDQKDTVDYLKAHRKKFHNDPPFTTHRPWDLNEYQHWRGRLSQLRQIYITQPKSLRIALFDKRNMVQLYTFWTALIIFLLTIIFGVISSVTAIISTKATLRGLDIAIQGLQLQLQQMSPSSPSGSSPLAIPT